MGTEMGVGLQRPLLL